MRRRTLLALGTTTFLSLAAFAPRRANLTIYAAASLTNAFNEIADTLKHQQPGLKIDINYAGSQALALQIQQGAVADVFASADDRWMTFVKDSGLVAGDPVTFVNNRLVVIVPKSNPARITKLEDLGKSGVKLVLAADAVPAGRYARTALSELSRRPGFTADYGQRVLRNVVSNEDNVKAVVAKVQLDEADAGVVYVSDVTPSVARLVTRFAFPDSASVLASYPIALLKRAPNTAAARAFIDLVLSPTGQAVLARNGFIPLPAKH